MSYESTSAHFSPDDGYLLQACDIDRTIIEHVAQPTNLLYFNIKDLGPFRAIQSLQAGLIPSNIPGRLDSARNPTQI